MLDMLGIGDASLADAQWAGLANEIYIFVALFFLPNLFRHVTLFYLPGKETPYRTLKSKNKIQITLCLLQKKLKRTDRENMITIESMHKWFGDFHVLKDINLEVKRGAKIVICGPSGSGKSKAHTMY
ncbi:MAG: hypothetical protein CM1200mP30_10530 [Pseudomonadota bacterium]|nr:MAG: hypothetical protein CM1200mP30_10530 [Pseudomonadota bacterium]